MNIEQMIIFIDTQFHLINTGLTIFSIFQFPSCHKWAVLISPSFAKFSFPQYIFPNMVAPQLGFPQLSLFPK